MLFVSYAGYSLNEHIYACTHTHVDFYILTRNFPPAEKPALHLLNKIIWSHYVPISSPYLLLALHVVFASLISVFPSISLAMVYQRLEWSLVHNRLSINIY